MSIISDITRAWAWLKKEVTAVAIPADKVAVTITEAIKTLLANPVANTLENIADAVTGTQVPTEVANEINAVIPKILAVELAIEGLPEIATPAGVLAFEQAILGTFNVSSNNSKLYTELSSQIYGIVQSKIDSGQTNFASWVDAVEQAYADYQKDLSANAPVVAPVPNPAADISQAIPSDLQNQQAGTQALNPS